MSFRDRYRIWIESEKRYLDPDEPGKLICLDPDGGLTLIIFEDDSCDIGEVYNLEHRYPSMVKENCIGLTDKLGSPIYEGDILKIWESWGSEVFNAGSLLVKWSESKFCYVGCFFVDGKFSDAYSIEICRFMGKVVGNIHNTEDVEEIKKKRGQTRIKHLDKIAAENLMTLQQLILSKMPNDKRK